MELMFNKLRFLFVILFTLSGGLTYAQSLDDFKVAGAQNIADNKVSTKFQFNGYTNYWQDIYRENTTYGSLFKMAASRIDYTIAQRKVELAEDLEMSGLTMQEGFFSKLIGQRFVMLDQPSAQDISTASKLGDILALVDPESETGKKLMSTLPKTDAWKAKLKSHQYDAVDLTEIKAFYLEKEEKTLFVISSKSAALRDKLVQLINDTKKVVEGYDLKRGWFGAGTMLKSVTIAAGHPLEVIGKGMNEGNSWFTFSGYMDFLAKTEIENWLAKVNLPIVTDFGSPIGYVKNIGNQAIFGCKDWDGMAPQNMYTLDSWLNFAHKKKGYTFRAPYDPEADQFHYDGYVAVDGNKEQIDNDNVPFYLSTGYLEEDAVACMVLFNKKGEQWNNDKMWESIMSRREVGIAANGKMMGPALFRNALELLVLDRVFLEEYFGDRINIEPTTKDDLLTITINNSYSHAVNGTLELVLPTELKLKSSLSTAVSLPAGGMQTLQFEIQPLASAMGITNPIAIHYKWANYQKSTVTMLDLPPAISAHQLLYGQSPKVAYPVSIHNYTTKSTFPVKVEVLDPAKANKIVYTASKECTTEKGTFKDMLFDLEVPAGNYNVKISALDTENLSQLGVGKAAGDSKLTVVDIDKDGVDEYVMENDSVKITLLTTGARVIEYFVKSRNNNVLFKLWPEKPADVKREFRKRGYYPVGGFEDFLGQGSMEGHKVYTAEVLKKEGHELSVRMTADYFGNKLEKTFTLYGNSPLLEVRYAMTFINPEANVIAPVPILILGKKHGTEDVYTVPEKNGLTEYRMKPEFYFGKIIFPTEGWDSGYDTQQDISFVGAFPVTRPLFLHMFQNLAMNGDAHYDFNEYQPWVPIVQKTTSYFTYYLWGAGGRWEKGVKELRDRNLITTH